MIDATQMGSWENMAKEYPAFGPPGISYYRGMRPDGFQVNCLLYRGGDGQLIGILAHFPQTIPNLERAGRVNLWVSPEHRLEGIARQLVFEFVRRAWPFDYEDMRTTPEGAVAIRQIVEELSKYRRRQRPQRGG